MRHLVVLVASMLVAGCGSVPRYKEPRGLHEGNSVTINRWSVAPVCAFQGLPSPNGLRACEARLMRAGEQRAFQVNTRLALGEHKLVLACMYGPPTPVSFPIPVTIATVNPMRYNMQQYTVEFTKPAYYRLESYWDGEVCNVRMLDAETGEAFPLGPSRPFIPAAAAAISNQVQ
ncbi:hypothetical protein [Stenotrophomonas sp.]|uniref:hypothetical protein n=1 Tax=Stenotrophomonas sp. TaxID=69392 RepID=UPI00289694B3|nr:hypothetical protein [Stenotrophomonas sp.]